MQVLHLVPMIFYCCYLALSISPAVRPWHFSSPTPLLVVSALTFLLMYECFIKGLCALFLLLHIICHGSPLVPQNFFPQTVPCLFLVHVCLANRWGECLFPFTTFWDKKTCTNNSIWRKIFFFHVILPILEAKTALSSSHPLLWRV